MDVSALDQGFLRVAGESAGLHPAGLKFRDWLVSSNEIQRLRINPYEVAGAADAPIDEIVAISLRGVALGLFDLHWLVHCPHCNMITRECGHFFELTHLSACSMCEVDFDVDVLTRVEVAFSLNRSIEDSDAAAFCLPPPALDPKVNIAGPPGGTVSGVDTIDRPGRYRFFCPITLAKGVLEISGEPTSELQEFRVQQLPSYSYDETYFAGRPGPVSFELANNCDKVSGIFIIPDVLPEELLLEALPKRLTGLEAIHYPEYRSLFGDQALAGSEHLQIASVTLLFTDIAGSTVLYEKLGNAAAYRAVRDHFDVLFGFIEKHGGFVIKTIGDAVMASFRSNDDAVACALEARRSFEGLNAGSADGHGISVKFGVHRGPAILVNLNGRLDYFGSAVNKAARIQNSAGPNELVFSSEARADCAVADTLMQHRDADLREEEIALKGIDTAQTVFRLGANDHRGSEAALSG